MYVCDGSDAENCEFPYCGRIRGLFLFIYLFCHAVNSLYWKLIYTFFFFFCRTKHPQKLLSSPLIKANTHPQFRSHNKRISASVQVGLLLSWDPLYHDYKRKKGSMIGDKSLNFYSYCGWIINWNSRGGYKMLQAEKDSVT